MGSRLLPSAFQKPGDFAEMNAFRGFSPGNFSLHSSSQQPLPFANWMTCAARFQKQSCAPCIHGEKAEKDDSAKAEKLVQG